MARALFGPVGGHPCGERMVEQPLNREDVRLRLGRRFRRQQTFTAGYAPLYARLFGLVADWLAEPEGSDPLADWLVRVGRNRSSFDVPLLLLAGLHRDILAGRTEVRDLARFFPSVGGTLPTDDDALATGLRRAIEARQEPLAAFIATAQVQTNETGRGLCWLLPVACTGWERVHLVELGASAGLNLVADQRHYSLIDPLDSRLLLAVGLGEPGQFTVVSEGAARFPARVTVPTVLSRLGCDLAPLDVATDEGARTLAGFVWGDQPERFEQLRQGIEMLRRVNRTGMPVRLCPVDLASGLDRFLAEQVDVETEAPIVLFNTYLTTYLSDRGASLRPQLAAWAGCQHQPVLWLQWETLWQGPKPPEFGWLGWSADLWIGGQHRHWHLAWVHPHGTRLRWLPDWTGWIDWWRTG